MPLSLRDGRNEMRTIEVVPYRKEWERLYEEEAALLLPLFEANLKSSTI